ncbi:MAG TPA: tRNA-guanine(15) transglycosylase, partial [Candidatus Nanopusillus sp.]|nr:tRNA-guanine(15) transglycosylase [Candidatus Nanopusillus sp.]
MESIVKAILNYQFGRGVGDNVLKNHSINIEVSKNTGRIRRVYVDKAYFGTVNATTGFIILSYKGAEI